MFYITYSNSDNHFSTEPFLSPSFTLIGFYKIIISFSYEIADIISSLFLNSKEFIPSKHLLRYFITKVGSFVFDMISISSSSERK